MNAIAQIATASLSNPLMPSDMGSAFRLAEMMSTGKLVPQHLQRQPGDCLMVIEQAMRWGMSPFAVAQCTSVIQGKLMFEGKLVGAALQTSGLLADRLSYEFSGEGATRSVKASATIRGEKKPREVTVELKDVKTTNGMWIKQPDQQLIYSANRVWGRRHAPEVMMGVYAPEEFEAPQQTFSGPVIDARAEPARPPDQKQTTAQYLNDSIPTLNKAPPTPKLSLREIIFQKLKVATTQQEVIAVGDSAEVQRVMREGPPDVKQEVNDMLADALERTRYAEDAAPDGDFSEDLPAVDSLVTNMGADPRGVA